MGKILHSFRSLIEIVAGSALILMAAVVIIQVFFRFVMNNSLSWSEEAARYLQVWITFVGSSIALRRGAHIGVDFLTSFFKGRVKWISNLFIDGVVAVFCVFVIRGGIKIVLQQMKYGQTSAALGLPMWVIYLAVPVGCGLMLIEDVVKLGKEARGYREYKKEKEEKKQKPDTVQYCTKVKATDVNA